jgi:isopentenyl phosphate kinase
LTDKNKTHTLNESNIDWCVDTIKKLHLKNKSIIIVHGVRNFKCFILRLDRLDILKPKNTTFWMENMGMILDLEWHSRGGQCSN